MSRTGAAAVPSGSVQQAGRRAGSRRSCAVSSSFSAALRPGHDVGVDDAEAAHRGLEGADAGGAGAGARPARPRRSRTGGRDAPARRGPRPSRQPGQQVPKPDIAVRIDIGEAGHDAMRAHRRGRCRRRSRSRSSAKKSGRSARSSEHVAEIAVVAAGILQAGDRAFAGERRPSSARSSLTWTQTGMS